MPSIALKRWRVERAASLDEIEKVHRRKSLMANPKATGPWRRKNPGPFHVGDRVRIPFGTEFIEATVVEDRGNLGVGGKRLYGVRFRVDDLSDEIYTERYADQLILVAGAPAAET
jgi:hypothetical protein